MAATARALARSLLTATSATLYTVPVGATTIITNIVLANSSASAIVVNLELDGVTIVPAVPMPANTTTAIDLRQVLAAGKTITGRAATAAVIGCHISGSEIS